MYIQKKLEKCVSDFDDYSNIGEEMYIRCM